MFNKRKIFYPKILIFAQLSAGLSKTTEIKIGDLTRRILFADQACFTCSGSTNLPNGHVYAAENPLAT